MTKKLSKEELIQAILATESNTYKHTHLRDKKNVELEQILFELQDKDIAASTQKAEPVKEAVEVAAPATAKIASEPAKAVEKGTAKKVERPQAPRGYTQETTLQIARPFYYHLRAQVGNVRVTNLGGGDAYVNSETVEHGNVNHRITAGETREFENVSILACFATSQPRLKIEEL